MSAEAGWVPNPTDPPPAGTRCRYCARLLRAIPHTPAEIEPHCTARGCAWCGECHRGETSVSPVRPSTEATA